MSQLPPQGNDANRLDFEKQVAAAARIARNSNLLQEGQGLELVSTTGFVSCFMLVGSTDHITKAAVISHKDAWETKTFVSAEILNTGYYTQSVNVVQ